MKQKMGLQLFSKERANETEQDHDGTNNSSQPMSPEDSTAKEKAKVDEVPFSPVRMPAEEEKEESTYPTGLRIAVILGSTFIGTFLVALDRLIISTAIPVITNEFGSVADIGWYGSSFLLANCAFLLGFGKLYTLFSVKAVFLTAIVLFEIGSAVCGAAPSSVAFIIGRAISGVGAAGIVSGSIVTIIYTVPLHKRAIYQGIFAAMFGIASVLGPVLGGAFTSKLSWRWCFYINLPFGAVTIGFIGLLLQMPDRETTKLPLKEKILQMDILGTCALLPGTVALLLALQWGGLEYAWSDHRVIAFLVLGAILLICFVAIQICRPDTATVPPRIVQQRSMVAACWAGALTNAHMMVFIYFLPIYFQAIKHATPIDSGLSLLPTCLVLVLACIIGGLCTTVMGYYNPFLLAGIAISCVGAGLLTTLQIDTDMPHWAGYQAIYGIGLGLGMQTPNLAAQTVLPANDVPVGNALILFVQYMGGAIFLSVAQNVLNNRLAEKLGGLEGFSRKLLKTNGATTIIEQFPESVRGQALVGYHEALREVFRVGLILACLTMVGAVFMEWKSIRRDLPRKKKKGERKDVEDGAGGGIPVAMDEREGTVGGSETTMAGEGSGEEERSENNKESSVAVVVKEEKSKQFEWE
ncbi:major facilitator superfamily domain-containing protein [Podospora australis]|uniref:Major facilitator superfamily domain-containing protein n=1 Tax=Podospora australis TaxID=1536484 RepID=A0AAN6X3P0_9PEZI|nr:major facilitator superfamily domain-containing protein [Podospora australis]